MASASGVQESLISLSSPHSELIEPIHASIGSPPASGPVNALRTACNMAQEYQHKPQARSHDHSYQQPYHHVFHIYGMDIYMATFFGSMTQQPRQIYRRKHTGKSGSICFDSGCRKTPDGITPGSCDHDRPFRRVSGKQQRSGFSAHAISDSHRYVLIRPLSESQNRQIVLNILVTLAHLSQSNRAAFFSNALTVSIDRESGCHFRCHLFRHKIPPVIGRGTSVSGNEVNLDKNTGFPNFITSNGGRPNPSAEEGNRNAVQREYSQAFSSSLTLSSTPLH